MGRRHPLPLLSGDTFSKRFNSKRDLRIIALRLCGRPHPRVISLRLDVSDNRLTASLESHILDRDFLLTFTTVLVQRADAAYASPAIHELNRAGFAGGSNF